MRFSKQHVQRERQEAVTKALVANSTSAVRMFWVGMFLGTTIGVGVTVLVFWVLGLLF